MARQRCRLTTHEADAADSGGGVRCAAPAHAFVGCSAAYAGTLARQTHTVTGRPALPVEIQRQLRREAWFGCCRCGSPFVEYHHILGIARTGHQAAEMMLLCPSCHHLATVGALDETEQRKLKTLPFNRRMGYA